MINFSLPFLKKASSFCAAGNLCPLLSRLQEAVLLSRFGWEANLFGAFHAIVRATTPDCFNFPTKGVVTNISHGENITVPKI